MIPKKIHYVWVGPKPIPDETRRFIAGWRTLNPDYEIIRWDESNIDFSSPFVRSAYAVGAWNRVANYTRSDVLLKHGGIYLDTDMELRRPLCGLLANQCFFGFQRKECGRDWVNVAAIGAVKGHWIPECFCRTLADEFDGWRYVASASGPGLATRILLDAGLSAYSDEVQHVRDVTLYPVRYFYPYWYSDRFTEACVTPDTYAIHHWAATWVPTGSRVPLPQRFVNRFARYAPALACASMRARVDLERKLRGS